MKIGVISLGCAKNQVDTQTMMGYLKAAGHTFTDNPEEAVVLIVNTCGFITPAKEESIDAIFEMAQYKEIGQCKLLVVTGCLSQRYPKELREEMPEVDMAETWGPLGHAAKGSSIVWYGVHAFEMLEKLMGTGAITVTTVPDRNGAVCVVAYEDGRRGVVTLTQGNYTYGGLLRKEKECRMFRSSGGMHFYHNLVADIGKFFRGEYEGVPLNESFEIMAMLEAAELSMQTSRTMPVYRMPKI